MDDLLGSIKKTVKLLLEDNTQEEQVRWQRLQQLLKQQTEQIAANQREIKELQNRLSRSNTAIDDLKLVVGELLVWKRDIQNHLQKIEEARTTILEKAKTTDASLSKSEQSTETDTSHWPRRFYADTYSCFSPYGFCLSDLSVDYQDQLYIIDQMSANEATYTVNGHLDFSRVISNYKYGLKAICEESSRSEHPTHLSVVKPGFMKLTDDVWLITEKLTINIL